MASKKKILACYPRQSIYVNNDISILEKIGDVKRFQNFMPEPGCNKLKSMLKIIINLKLLFFKILGCDIVYKWFADEYSFFCSMFSKVLRKKCFIVIGGYEVYEDRELDYGLIVSDKKKSMVKWAIEISTKTIAVNQGIAEMAIKNLQIPPEKVSVCHLGFNCSVINDFFSRENIVITAARIDTLTDLKVKGLDILLSAAKKLPDYRFIIFGTGGKAKEYLLDNAPENVIIEKILDVDEKNSLYNKSKVYAQLSKHESFGAGVIEAMAGGCIPVISDELKMKDLFGKYGYIVPYGDSDSAAYAIKEAINSYTQDKAEKAMEILDELSLSQRENNLKKIILEEF